MKLLAAGVWRLKQFPAPSVNVYLAGDVLIDAGTRWDRRRIFAEIEGRELSLLALTHVHPDHQGVAKDVCEALDILKVRRIDHGNNALDDAKFGKTLFGAAESM